ncbi:hypothetical protein ACS126_09945 [Sphingobacterium lactis]|uniref:hypothetical protein n=1 Tax=Sphingobacterium lactis TaxID=797291 RepID=UPI003EC8336A
MKEFFRQYRKIAIIVGVAFAIFGFSFIICYDTNDLFRLPFNSNVWGTASDWIMIVVTIFTAIFLVRTFNEQKRSNDIQNEKHLKNILPKFLIYQINSEKIDVKPSASKPEYYLVIKLELNNVRDLEFDTISPIIINDLLPSPYEEVGSEFSFQLRSKLISKIDDIKTHILTLRFQDIEGNPYIQNAYIKNNKVYLENPEAKVY